MRAALVTLVALAAAAVALLLLPAGQATAGSGSEPAVVTIGRLEAEGFTVHLDRVGSAPLSDCVVADVRNPQEQTRLVRLHGTKGRDRTVEVVTSRTISVSLDCSSR
ncbi:MAG: hypothetical protein QOD90_4502 [Mycobacterium sp.]|jgi:hypothetical protein|nr:hypothetical protein [Mycobacterium sp.]